MHLFVFAYKTNVRGNNMKYLSVKEAAMKWNMTARRVQALCTQNRIDGVERIGNVWCIPLNASKPNDARKKINSIIPNNNKDIIIERVWAMPNKNTFDIKPIASLIQDEITQGTWIDPFANKNKFANITNDLNEKYDTDYHLDALDFLKIFEDESVDGVLYDPPYSPRQVSECYNDVGYNVTWDTTKASFWGNHKKEISRIVKIGGKVITFGWNSGGIGYKYGFEIERILMVPHGGWHNDTICTVEVKTHNGINDKIPNSIVDEQQMDLFDNRTEEEENLVKILKELPERFWDFKGNDVHEYTHGLHSYPAVMVAPISQNIIRLVKKVKNINSLLDPFVGSGTVLVEGLLAGINKVTGCDINPLALYLSKVKTTNIDINLLQQETKLLIHKINENYNNDKNFYDSVNAYITEQEKLDISAKEGWGENAHLYLEKYCKLKNKDYSLPSFKNLGYWFKPNVILLLQLIKNCIAEIKNIDIRDFYYIAMSETIRYVSNRRNGEFKMFRLPKYKLEIFSPNVIKTFEDILKRNTEKMNEFGEILNTIDTKPEVSILNNNAMTLNDVEDNEYDLIITSPPYGDSRTTVAYGEYSRLSLQWLNIDNLTNQEIMSIDKSLMGGKKYRNGFEYSLHSETLRKALERIKDIDIERSGDVFSFYKDLDESIRTIAQKTKKEGYQFWVVGNRTVKNIYLQTDKIISELAQNYGLKHIYTIDRNISNKVMPSLNSPTNISGEKVATMTNEHIVVLKKIS